MNSDSGTAVFLFLGFVVLPTAAIVWSVAREKRRGREVRQALDESLVARATRITGILERVECRVADAPIRKELDQLLRAQPIVGYRPELTLPGGWFERVSARLLELAASGRDRTVAAWYFQTFIFPATQQGKALEFLLLLLKQTRNDENDLDLFRRIADRVLTLSSPDEAQWLYARTLELVRERNGSPTSKALALYVGRHSYRLGGQAEPRRSTMNKR